MNHATVNLAEVNDTEEYYDEDQHPDQYDPMPPHIHDCIAAFPKDPMETDKVINACVIEEAPNACVTDEVENACITKEEWFLDFGASSHITGNSNLLSNITPSNTQHIRTVKGQLMSIASQGTVSTIDSLGAIKIIDCVLYIPGIKTNLLLVGKLTNIGYQVFFESQDCLIYDNTLKRN